MFSTEPLSIGGVLDQGISLFRSSFKQTIGLSLLAALPYVIALTVMNYASAGMTQLEEGASMEDIEASMSGVFAVMPFLYLALFFLWGAVGHRLAAIARNQPLSASADIGFGLKVMIPLTLVTVLFTLVIGVGLVLLIIPGLILMVTMSQFANVSIMEDRSTWSSLWRSHKLVWRGNYWRTAVVVTVISILGFVIGIALYLGLGAVTFAQATSESVSPVLLGIEALVNLAIMALLMPLTIAMFLVLYNDLLVRREGGDLDEQLAALDEGGAAS